MVEIQHERAIGAMRAPQHHMRRIELDAGEVVPEEVQPLTHSEADGEERLRLARPERGGDRADVAAIRQDAEAVADAGDARCRPVDRRRDVRHPCVAAPPSDAEAVAAPAHDVDTHADRSGTTRTTWHEDTGRTHGGRGRVPATWPIAGGHRHPTGSLHALWPCSSRPIRGISTT